MKLKLSTNKQEEIEGVIKVVSPEHGDNIYDLDKYADHNECEEVLCELADYVPTAKLQQFITSLTTKLAHKGKLTVIGTDALQVTHAFKNGKIDIIEFNKLVYGERTKVWNFKQSLVSLHDVHAIMKAAGLKIITKRLSDFQYLLVGERE